MIKFALAAALVLFAGCVVNDTIGSDGIGLAPEVGNVFDCDLIIELGRAPATPADQIQHVHDISHPCIGDDSALDGYEQAWVDEICTPAIQAFGAPGGGCYGACTKQKSNFCLVGD